MAMPDRIWIDSKPWDDLDCGGWEYEECEDADTEYVRKDWLVEQVNSVDSNWTAEQVVKHILGFIDGSIEYVQGPAGDYFPTPSPDDCKTGSGEE